MRCSLLSRYLLCGWARYRCRCGGSAVVSRSQQGAAVSLLLARSSTDKASRWRRIGGFVVAKSQVERGTGSASPSGRISVISFAGQSFVVGGVLVKTVVGQSFALAVIPLQTEMLGPTCWPYLYQNTPLVSGGLVHPPYEKMRSN